MPEADPVAVKDPVADPASSNQDMPGGTPTAIPDGHWGGDDSLYDGMGEDTKADAQKLALRFDTSAKAMAAHLSAHQMRGQSIMLPKADATPEEKTAIYRKIGIKMGCPEDQNNYAIPAPEDMPDGFALSDDKMTGLKGLAFKHNLSQDAFKELLGMHLESAVELKQQLVAGAQAVTKEKEDLEKAEWDTALSDVRKEWGADAEERIEHAKKWAESKWKDKGTRMRFCYKMYVKDIAEGKLMDGSGHGQQVKTVFDSHEGE